MTTISAEPNVRSAAALVYKALHTSLVPASDSQYLALLALYRADANFRRHVQDVADGLELVILDASESRGLIAVPSSRDSKFAMRLSDMRQSMRPEQKAALVLAHIAVAAAFFPTTDGLDDDNFSPPPVSVARCRDTLYTLCQRLKASAQEVDGIPLELAPGWQSICDLPLTDPAGQRAALNSVVGTVRVALNQMRDGGLVRVDREGDDDESLSYTPTHRLRVQLRELALRRLYEMAQLAVTTRGTAP